MPDNTSPPRRWLQVPYGIWTVPVAFVVGLAMGSVSLIIGRHGSVWPTIILCAPASLAGWLLSSTSDSEVPYICMMIGGSAVLYALYAGAVAIRPKTWCALTITTFHAVSAAVLAMFAH